MVEVSEYGAQVARIPMFQELREETRARVCSLLLSMVKPSVFVAGDILYMKGAEDPGTGALLVEGALAVGTGDGEELIVDAPELLGEMQMFDEYGQRTATVTATQASVVLEFVWNDFIALAISGLTQQQQLEVKAMLTAHAGARQGELSGLAGGAPAEPEQHP